MDGGCIRRKRRRKILSIILKNENPSIKSTRQMRTQVDTTQRKKKTNNQQKSGEDPMQRGLVAMK
jgi:hypothetical protein